MIRAFVNRVMDLLVLYKSREFLGQLNDYQLYTIDPAPRVCVETEVFKCLSV
jgi:hypothetical protein